MVLQNDRIATSHIDRRLLRLFRVPKMNDYRKSPEPELEIQYSKTDVLWIGASGVSAFSEGETMAQGLILEYDREGIPVGVVLTRSALESLRQFLNRENEETIAKPLGEKATSDGD